jgi:glycosyltransferase involved in cell wall biosynthesis
MPSIVTPNAVSEATAVHSVANRRPLRVLELRSVRGTGGGPEKTILLGSAATDPERYAITVCYLRDNRDADFGPAHLARDLAIDYVEIRERHSFDRRVWPALRRLVSDRRIDIVHAHDYKTDLLAWMLSRTDRIIPLATVHGWAGASWRERAYYVGDKQILRRYSRLIAVSTAIRNELIRTGTRPETVTVVLNAIDPDVFQRHRSRERAAREAFGIPEGTFVVGAIGRLDRRKRFDLLMEAFATLHLGAEPTMLVIAGEGPARAQLEAVAVRLRLGDRCRLVGLQADVVALHHVFDLFVQSSEAEGTPNAVLEAMAMETPIVATDVGGTGELVTADVDALLVPPNRVDVLARAIERGRLQRPEATARAASARRRVETALSFNNRMRRVETIYDELASHRTVVERPIP